MQIAVWRNWSSILSQEEKGLFSKSITDTLVYRRDLSHFVRSKIEQVLASICIESQTLAPVLSLITNINDPNIHIGLSALRTSLETIFSDDPQIFPEQRRIILMELSNVICQLTDVISSISFSAFSSCTNADTIQLLLSLELTNLIISKVEVS